jgi:hypothetical protein
VASQLTVALLVPFGQLPAVAFTPIVLSELVALLLEVVQESGPCGPVAIAAGAKREDPSVSMTNTAMSLSLAMRPEQ